MLRRTLLFVLVCGVALAATSVHAGVDEGMAHYVPWSGSFWPIRFGHLIQGPLRKYDRATGHRAASWELQENPPLAEVPEWFGYCHAWAAAAVMDREPTRLRQVVGVDGTPFQLGIGDQKGMLTSSHTDDVAQHYGVRYQGGPDEDLQDIYPDELWRVLKLYIKQRGVPLILDIEEGEQVWNHPVYAYRVVYQPTGTANEYTAEMSLWMADDAVPPDIVGVQVSKQTYYFTFRLQGGAAQLGSGRWVGPSVHNHPDFAWFPYIVRAENPEVKYEKVKQLVDASGSAALGAAAPDRRPPTAPAPRPRQPVTTPGTTPGTTRLPPNIVPRLPAQSPTAPGLPGRMPATPDRADVLPAQQRPYLLSPVELLSLVTNKTSHFTLDVTVDKFDGGKYTPGEVFSVSGTSAAGGYLYLLYLDSQGQLAVLFPRPGEANQIPAQRRFHLPRPQAGYAFRTFAAPGIHRIKAVATRVPLLFSGLSPRSGTPQQQVAQPGRFTLPPGQESMFRDMLGRHLRYQPIEATELGSASPRQFLGDFGQDEVAIYVGPAGSSSAPAHR